MDESAGREVRVDRKKKTNVQPDNLKLGSVVWVDSIARERRCTERELLDSRQERGRIDRSFSAVKIKGP